MHFLPTLTSLSPVCSSWNLFLLNFALISSSCWRMVIPSEKLHANWVLGSLLLGKYALNFNLLWKKTLEGVHQSLAIVTYRNTGATSEHFHSLPHASARTTSPSLAFAPAEELRFALTHCLKHYDTAEATGSLRKITRHFRKLVRTSDLIRTCPTWWYTFHIDLHMCTHHSLHPHSVPSIHTLFLMKPQLCI